MKRILLLLSMFAILGNSSNTILKLSEEDYIEPNSNPPIVEEA